jgi:hypothetical protein
MSSGLLMFAELSGWEGRREEEEEEETRNKTSARGCRRRKEGESAREEEAKVPIKFRFFVRNLRR